MLGESKCKIETELRVRDHTHLFSMEDKNKFKISAKKKRSHLHSFESKKKIKQLSLNCHQFSIKRNLPFKSNKNCKVLGMTDNNYYCIFSKNRNLLNSTIFFK